MDFPVIDLFPPGLSSSVITCVWVGLAVVVFFNLRLGWVLSGLVVPGYLVPLLALRPWSVAAILIEAVVTYLLVWLYSERMKPATPWSSVFGRDRFFALLVVSVIVRLIFDGKVFPAVGDWLMDRFSLAVDFQSNLHSFGLVIVTLIANLFWKPGLTRGLAGLVVIVAITFSIVQGLLVPFTNFSLGNLQYIYEDLAASLLASPKAYIILLSAAFIASRMNLFYGWEYSGILIPSLLALQWYQPTKILTSFAEAFVILFVAHFILRSRWARGYHIEGARKIFLFFTIGFVYKWILAYALLRWAPYVKVTDAFAFGYLLATLIAIKMHDKEMVGVLTRANLQTSLTAVFAATAIGYMLTLLPIDRSQAVPAPASAVAPPTTTGSLLEDLRRLKPSVYAHNRLIPRPRPEDLSAFDEALRALDKYLLTREPRHLDEGRTRLQAIGYDLVTLEGRYLFLRERDPSRGWGAFVLNLEAASDLSIEVPAPAEERGTLDAAAWLLQLQRARALAVAGAPRRSNPDRSSDVLVSRESLFFRFHRHFGGRGTLQVRGYTPPIVRQWRRAGTYRPDVPAEAAPPPTLWVRDTLPEGLDMEALNAALPELVVLWQSPGQPNLERRFTAGGFAELYLDENSLRRLSLASIRRKERARRESRIERIDGYLQSWLLEGKGRLAAAGSGAYRPPNLEELFYFDEEVLTPILRLVRESRQPGWDEQRPPAALDVVAGAAYTMGYHVVWYRHQRTGQRYILLQERFGEPDHAPRHWGTYVFRLGAAAPLVIQVPRPLFERNSFEYGVSLFERMRAGVLQIAGAHPLANGDGSADPVRYENLPSVFNLVHQVTVRESWDEPLHVLQIRAFSWKPQMGSAPPDALLAAAVGTPPPHPPPVIRTLLERLAADGLNVAFVDGDPTGAGYEATALPQALYPQVVPRKSFFALWLSPYTRSAFRPQADDRLQQQAFAAVGIPTLRWDLPAVLPPILSQYGTVPLPGGLKGLVDAYVDYGDVVALHRARAGYAGLRLARIVDAESHQAFLLIRDARGAVAALANLNPLDTAPLRTASSGRPVEAIEGFIESRGRWLEFALP